MDDIHVNPSNLKVFMSALESTRSKLSDNDWRSFVSTNRTLKEWRYYLLRDPYTRWGYVKPRGYPGDAMLMDFAYGHPSTKVEVDAACEIGKLIYEHTRNAKQSLSAVSRIQFISELLDSKLSEKKIDIATIASGHGREYEVISPSAKENIKSILAIDSDNISLNEFGKTSLDHTHITKVSENIFRTRLGKYGQRDLVYSLGLFDYLNDASAIKVLENMCSCVSEEGTVVIANLNHQAANLGYCEAIMDWWMIPRSEEELKAISKEIKNIPSKATVEIERIDCFCYLIIKSG